MKNEIKENITEYSEEFKRNLDIRYSNYHKNELSAVTAAESKKRIGIILKSK